MNKSVFKQKEKVKTFKKFAKKMKCFLFENDNNNTKQLLANSTCVVWKMA